MNLRNKILQKEKQDPEDYFLTQKQAKPNDTLFGNLQISNKIIFQQGNDQSNVQKNSYLKNEAAKGRWTLEVTKNSPVPLLN